MAPEIKWKLQSKSTYVANSGIRNQTSSIIPVNFSAHLKNIIMWYVNSYLVNKNQQGIAASKSGIKILHDSESLWRKLIVAGSSDLTKQNS